MRRSEPSAAFRWPILRGRWRKSEETEHGLPGNEWFYEHVHFRPEGNYLLAATVYRELSTILPQWVRQRAAGVEGPISLETCCRRIALTGWDRVQMEEDMAAMTDRPPFTGQLDHRQRQAARRLEIERLRAKFATPAALDDAQAIYQAAIEAAPDDLDLRFEFARLLQKKKDYAGAIQQWRLLLARFPAMAKWHMNLGVVFSTSGNVSSALAEFDKAAGIEPTLRALAAYNSAHAWLNQGKTFEAERLFRRALELNPWMSKASNAQGAILVSQGKTAEARQAFRRALEADPALVSAPSTWGLSSKKKASSTRR